MPRLIIVAIAISLALCAGCSGGRRAYRVSPTASAISDCQIRGLRPGEWVIVVTKNGKRQGGRFIEMTCGADTTVTIAARPRHGAVPDTARFALSTIDHFAFENRSTAGSAMDALGVVAATVCIAAIVSSIVTAAVILARGT